MEQTVLQQDNQILESINDQYLAKKKKKKTIIYSILLSLVLILSSLIITFSFVQVNLEPKFLDNANEYTIYISNSFKDFHGAAEFESEDEDAIAFLEEYNKMFKSTALSALFSGKLGGYQIVERDKEETKLGTAFYPSGSTSGMSTNLKNLVGSNYIRLSFDEPQYVLENNGNVYISKVRAGEHQLKFKDAYLVLDEENTMKFYVGTYSDTTNPVITKIVVNASTASLYQYLK